jgi:XRE family aerobic/anaerobic benzoate catabolism transcriptional regulator
MPAREPGAASTLRRLGDAIARHRIVSGTTQEDVAEKARVAVQSLRRIESGTGNPSYLTLSRIAAALGVPLEQLVREAN